MIDAYVEEKIQEVETWFQILCGIGEEGWTEEKLIENLVGALNGLTRLITQDESSLQGPRANMEG